MATASASSPPSPMWHVTGTLIDLWDALQVELHGQYPLRRVNHLQEYLRTTSGLRVLLTCLVTPMPCLVLVLLMDFIPLRDPREGIQENFVFWLRNWLAVAFITVAVLEQFRNCLPRLPISNVAMLAITAFATSAGVGWQFAGAYMVGFPVPFSLIFGTIMWTPAVITGCSVLWGKKLMQDKALLSDMLEYLVAFMCQVSLTLIYPAYIYVFNSLSGWPQNAFVLLLPFIKIVTKNWISRFLHDVDDVKPEVVIFNIEVFNALYISCSLSSASSTATTVLVMLVDLLQAWLSLRDIDILKKQLDHIIEKLPQDSGLTVANYKFLDVCEELLLDTQLNSNPALRASHVESLYSKIVKGRTRRALYAQSTKHITHDLAGSSSAQQDPGLLFDHEKLHIKSTSQLTRCEVKSATVVPITSEMRGLSTTAAPQQLQPPEVKVSSRFSALPLADRLLFVHSSTKLLFLTEFVVLVEYTEVIMPVIYTMYLIAMSNVPNRQFYPSLAVLNKLELEEIMTSVVIYSALELISFLLFALLVNRKLKISTLHQVAFVLDKHASDVQSKLVLWTFYVVQSMLVHFGAYDFIRVDFSMKFAWLHRTSP